MLVGGWLTTQLVMKVITQEDTLLTKLNVWTLQMLVLVQLLRMTILMFGVTLSLALLILLIKQSFIAPNLLPQ